MKINPYKHKERYFSWKEEVKKKGIPRISEFNSDLILRYIENMEHRINISTTNIKGARSYTRLNTLREKVIFFAKRFNEVYETDKITDITEEQLIKFFSGMRSGKIKRKDGKEYRSASDFVKIFKAFWHWHQKVNREKGLKLFISLEL